MNIIRVENLTKEFKQRKGREGLGGAVKDLFDRKYRIIKAVDNISFSVEKGEILGYIGPNGAGKSTTIKMLTGILVPTRGHVEVNGLTPHKERVKNARRIGVVFGQRTQLWWDIPLSETLNLMRYLYDVPEELYHENLKVFYEVLGIDAFINAPVRQLSLGQRMRADLSCALLHNPDILYLDEPTIGLDVVVKEGIRNLIKEMNRIRATTIILATHDMSDIEKLCSRVLVIDQGQIMYNGSLEALRKAYGIEETLEADIKDDIADISGLYELGVQDIKREDNHISIKYDTNIASSSIILGWLMGRTEIENLRIERAKIEDIIRSMYKDISSERTKN